MQLCGSLSTLGIAFYASAAPKRIFCDSDIGGGGSDAAGGGDSGGGTGGASVLGHVYVVCVCVRVCVCVCVCMLIPGSEWHRGSPKEIRNGC